MKIDFKLIMSLLILASLTSFQAAQEVEEDEDEVVEEVVVTGSRIARDPNDLLNQLR